MPAKRKEVSPPNSPDKDEDTKVSVSDEKSIVSTNKADHTFQQYLILLNIADGLAESYNGTDAVRFCATSLIRKLNQLKSEDQFFEEALMFVFRLIDVRFKRPKQSSETSFLDWVKQGKWTEERNMRSKESQEFVMSVFEQMDTMVGGKYSSQRAEDITEAVNVVLNELVLECIVETITDKKLDLFECHIRSLECTLDITIEYLVDYLECQLFSIRKSLAEA